MMSMISDSEWPTESTSPNNGPRFCLGLNSNARSLSDGECSSGPETRNYRTESGQRSQLNSKPSSTRKRRRKPGQCSLTLLGTSNYQRQNWVKDITLLRRRFTQNGASTCSLREERQPVRPLLSKLTCDKSSKI